MASGLGCKDVLQRMAVSSAWAWIGNAGAAGMLKRLSTNLTVAKWRMHSVTVLLDCTIHGIPVLAVVHVVHARGLATLPQLTTRKFTTALTFLYCGTDWRSHYYYR